MRTVGAQAARTMEHVRGYEKMINKYMHLENLHSANTTLFYKARLACTVLHWTCS